MKILGGTSYGLARGYYVMRSPKQEELNRLGGRRSSYAAADDDRDGNSAAYEEVR